MKRKEWKKTAAFVTSLTMATTMMPAELASVIVSAAEANTSAEIAKLDWTDAKYDTDDDGIRDKSYIKSIKVNGATQSNIISNNDMTFAAGSSVEIISRVPLNIVFNHNNFTLAFDDFADDLGIDYEEEVFTRNDKAVSKEAVLAEMLNYAGYNVNDETFTASWNVDADGNFGANNPVVTVAFAAIETAENDQYTYKFTMPDDNGNTTGAGNMDTVSISTSNSSIKVNFYENEEARRLDQQEGSDAHVWTETQEDDACDEHFAGLLIASSNDDQVGTYTEDQGVVGPHAVIVGDTVTITAANPFVAHVSDGNAQHPWINATNSFEDGTYKSVFTMPKYDGTAAAPNNIIVIDIVKVDETYTYTVDGSKLLADADTGSFTGAVAANIIAKWYDMPADDIGKDNIITKLGTDEEVAGGKEINGAVPNGKFVAIKAVNDGRITANPQGINKPFKVTKNGETEYETDIAGGHAATTFGTDGTAGTYDTTYSVKGTDGKIYKLNYSFRIAAKNALTAEDVELTLSAKENNKPVAEEVLAGTAANNYTDGIMAPGETIKDEIEDGEVVTFMLAKGKAEEIAESGNSKYQFSVTPAIDELLDGMELDPDKCYVTGYTSGSTLSNIYEFTIHVTDPEYGGSIQKPKDINIKWRVVSYDEIPHWNNNRFETSEEDVITYGEEIPDAQISIDELDSFEDVLLEKSLANEAAKKAVEDGEVRYQWIKAPGADRTREKQDELDEFDDGLPSELGDYTVYIIYDDVVQATVDVSISLYSVSIFADEEDLTFKYGHTFELTKPTVQKNVNGEVVDVEIENLTCQVWAIAKDDEGEYITDEETGLYVPEIEPVKVGDIESVGQLDAGLYYIVFTGHSLDEDYAVKEVPQLLTVNKKTLDDPSIVILIDPFAYDGSTKDVVKDRANNFTVRDTDFEESDPRYNISDLFKITEGAKRSNVGSYDCSFRLVTEVVNVEDQIDALELKLADANTIDAVVAIADAALVIANEAANVAEYNNLPNAADIRAYANTAAVEADDARTDNDTVAGAKSDADVVIDAAKNAIMALAYVDADGNDQNYYNDYKTSVLDNFEGSTKESKWHITAEEADPDEVEAGLKWVDKNTTLYDNGRIHLEVTRNADDKINKNKTVAKIAKFGVVIDKEGKIEAPELYNAYSEVEKAAAEKFLQVGNGFTEGGYTKTTEPVTCASQTYKVNVKVTDVETGVWARPYVLYEDGTVSYGEVKYLDLTNEAVKRLQLWTAPVADDGEKAVRKADLDEFQAKSEALIKENVKSGYNTADNKFYVYSRYIDLQKAGFTNVAEVADFGIVADRDGDFDAALENVAAAAAADGLDVNAALKAYMTKNLKKETAAVVGHYNKNNAVLGVNEYAASIKLGNAATGCWVRSYIDLGNGLVIYNEPMYIESASDYYGNEIAGTFNTVWETKKLGGDDYDYYNRLVFTHTEAANDRIDDFITAADIDGLEAEDVEIVKTGVVADKSNKLVRANKMILGSGFINGEHKDSYNNAYSAKLTPKDTNDVSVRTYTIFKIKGEEKDVEVTVYGDVQTFKYNTDDKRVKYSAEKDIYTLDDEILATDMNAEDFEYPVE